MKRVTKTFLTLFLIGLAGIIVMMSIIMGGGMIRSFEAKKSYDLPAGINELKIIVQHAEVAVVPSDQSPELKVYSKAWLSKEIDLDERVKITEKNGTVIIEEIPYESNFFGIFPQPYEIKFTAYVPQPVYQKYVTSH